MATGCKCVCLVARGSEEEGEEGMIFIVVVFPVGLFRVGPGGEAITAGG